MNLSEIVRENPRLKPVAPDVIEGFRAYVAERPNARVLWVEEYARAVVEGEAHRAGIVAITSDSIVLSWKHGFLYRSRSHREIRRGEVTAWQPDELGVSINLADGEVRLEFRPESAEASSFNERLVLIRPFGPRR